jgi:hypothetical protein
MRKHNKRSFFLLFPLCLLLTASASRAEVLTGKVTSIHGDVIELSLGSEKGIKSGDSGRVYYTIRVGQQEKTIYIAKFKITHLSERSSMAQIEDSTGEVKAGYSVEVIVKDSVWLEVKSEPSGAKVYIDGKESGDTPLALTDIKTGRHQIRVVKDGYESYEVSVDTGVGRKEVMANLKQVARKGELVIRTVPTEATIYLNQKSVGTGLFEGKGLSPGKYKVRVTKDGYESWEQEVTVKPDEKNEVLARLRLEEGELEVNSVPAGARAFLDGRDVGETPVLLPHVKPGFHRIKVIKQGHEPYEEQTEVRARERKRISASLELTGGRLLISTEPAQANIYIDGKLAGMGSYDGKSLSPRSYKVRVLKEGYEPWEKDITLKPGDKMEVLAKLELMGGELSVNTEPSGAKIYVDGKFVGNTSHKGKDLNPGLYRLRVVKEGYEAWNKDVKIEAGKKIEVLAKLEEIDWTKTTCDAPVLNVEDRWIYKNPIGEVWAEAIVAIKEDLFIMKVAGHVDFLAYDKKTMNIKFLIEKGHQPLEYKGLFRKLYNFPILVGKKWNDTVTGRFLGGSTDQNHSCEIRIEGIEAVTTPAGVFKAFKIYYKQTMIAPGFRSGWVRYWYSPVVKNWIKREVEKSPYWGNFSSAQLISYELK